MSPLIPPSTLSRINGVSCSSLPSILRNRPSHRYSFVAPPTDARTVLINCIAGCTLMIAKTSGETKRRAVARLASYRAELKVLEKMEIIRAYCAIDAASQG